MNSIGRTIWGSVIATSAMTFFMMLAHKKLPEEERSPLPPATLTDETLHFKSSSDSRQNASLISHFAYGVFLAGIYGAVRSGHKPSSPSVKGAEYGLAVWFANYVVALPVLGYRSNAFSMPARRNSMMLLAHLLWGAVLGKSLATLKEEGTVILDGSLKRSGAE